jgi:hypothetical protein
VNSDDIIIKGLDKNSPNNQILISFSYIWFKAKLLSYGYKFYGIDYSRFQASNDLGSQLTDRLYFRVRKSSNDLKWKVKKLREYSLDEKPNHEYKFFDFFEITTGNGMMFDEDIPASDFEFKTEPKLRVFSQESSV